MNQHRNPETEARRCRESNDEPRQGIVSDSSRIAGDAGSGQYDESGKSRARPRPIRKSVHAKTSVKTG